jgi:hypothetical protein
MCLLVSQVALQLPALRGESNAANEDALLAGCMARLSTILALQEGGLERRDAEVLADRRGDRDRGRLAVQLLLAGHFAVDEGGRILHRRTFCHRR